MTGAIKKALVRNSNQGFLGRWKVDSHRAFQRYVLQGYRTATTSVEADVSHGTRRPSACREISVIRVRRSCVAHAGMRAALPAVSANRLFDAFFIGAGTIRLEVRLSRVDFEIASLMRRVMIARCRNERHAP